METENNKFLLPGAIVVAGIIVALGLVLDVDEPRTPIAAQGKPVETEGLTLPVTWGDLGRQMVANGTIDPEKLQYAYEFDNKELEITRENAGRLLNVLWALGLSSKNEILEQGEMTDPRFGGVENFASTAGWTAARGSAMSHYSMHRYFELDSEQQNRVDRVSRDIYRPCCSNSAHFPDCNHGMAMLGLLELLASQGAGEEEMRNAALAVNSYWFPSRSSPGGCSIESGATPAPTKQSGCGL
ncbi:MAG: hypothetical protein A3J09_01090 [Candidatus Zambryskibacteria bacterium RIFCSPLOWO2_02_FULL_51_21]|uniref:Uncharacterized protein n=1 Tax=Candidatus Zambryskibacteria bacterium RIFCSPHIGHO2_02_FULL_43_37 TaxID=1802749 RepID=A0A1G2TIU4_9BACT|nr:MAG: hypothetical protein A2723_01090 [Candidatus Zambryskibacteria bacterium RIFCSPHIGHO2_01_FULL_52_18]OHA96589.1 MAG: hypothetical protein A3D49_01810 [Candidatus Zambryskibacteria bacterium RIFCSPHIGHO2_02_FULL_43_37]OHB07638.1 MAG: hypothetical protein A2944_00830 [Candidatus Zambryskibacteria bacterium RIFCSPLOWO2_01_FULL_52_12]OHB11147.1 MAG: hypothetical protein A3J09_01090 [Candidatus Zambryskibacteria bacterium RIFCSPLOWO2_02_FULL_51_21]